MSESRVSARASCETPFPSPVFSLTSLMWWWLLHVYSVTHNESEDHQVTLLCIFTTPKYSTNIIQLSTCPGTGITSREQKCADWLLLDDLCLLDTGSPEHLKEFANFHKNTGHGAVWVQVCKAVVCSSRPYIMCKVNLWLLAVQIQVLFSYYFYSGCHHIMVMEWHSTKNRNRKQV